VYLDFIFKDFVLSPEDLPLKLLSSHDPLLSFGQIIQEMNYLQKFMPHLMKSISLRHLLRELKILANFQKQRNTSMKLYYQCKSQEGKRQA